MRTRSYPTEQGLDLIEMGQEGLQRFSGTQPTTDDIQFALFLFESLVKKGAQIARIGDALAHAEYIFRAALRGEVPEQKGEGKAACGCKSTAA